MNQTVAKIVEIMFQDTIMNEEVQALRDEVMNNCQERYQDMLARGMDEDDAIAAVIDSLKGMEEVVAQYPRKEQVTQSYVEPNGDGEAHFSFTRDKAQRIRVLLSGDDVNVETSMDDMVHVCYDREKMPYIRVRTQHGVLTVDADHSAVDQQEQQQSAPSQDDPLGLGFIMEGVKIMLKNVKFRVSGAVGGEVTISIPEGFAPALDLHTTSGDVDVEDVAVAEMLAETTSGDVTATFDSTQPAEKIIVKGASGDVEVNADAKLLTISTVSGDVEYNGACPDITLSTVSGDAELNGVMKRVNVKTVSGDVDMDVRGEWLQDVTMHTTSGDLELCLPAEMHGRVSTEMQTVSGDQWNYAGEVTGTPAATVRMKSISGDLTIR